MLANPRIEDYQEVWSEKENKQTKHNNKKEKETEQNTKTSL